MLVWVGGLVQVGTEDLEASDLSHQDNKIPFMLQFLLIPKIMYGAFLELLPSGLLAAEVFGT